MIDGLIESPVIVKRWKAGLVFCDLGRYVDKGIGIQSDNKSSKPNSFRGITFHVSPISIASK